MKRNRKKGFVLFLMLVIILTMGLIPSAAAKPEKEPKARAAVNTQVKPEKVVRDAAWAADKAAAEEAKDLLEAQKDTLEAQYEEFLAAGDTAAAAAKAEELAAVKASFMAAKANLKSVIRTGYTLEELSALEAAAEALTEADPTIEILPVENIMVKGKHLGFDTPPVIKAGRTLVPVKALVQAFGANVKWDAATQTVTITKGELTLIFTLGKTEVLVNNKTIQLDVPAQTMNSRTVVPLRFIAEQMGFKVTYEDGDITVEEGEETESTETESTESAGTDADAPVVADAPDSAEEPESAVSPEASANTEDDGNSEEATQTETETETEADPATSDSDV